MRHRSHNQLHTLSAIDYEGYGVYEHDGPSVDGMGAVAGFGQTLPALDLKQLQTGVEEIGTLAHVPVSAKASSIQLLDTMVFTESEPPLTEGKSGTALLVIGQDGGGWASRMLDQGLVLMVDRESVPTGVLDVLATDKPATVALYAGMPNKVGGAQWVIVDGPPAVLQSASVMNGGGGIPVEPGGGPGGGGGAGPLPPFPLPGGGGVPGGGGSPIPGMPTIPGTHAPPCGAGETEVMGVCFPLGSAPHMPPCDPSEDLINGMCFPKPGGVVGPGGGGGGQQPAPGGGGKEPGKSPQKPAKAGISNKAIIGGLVAVAAIGGIALVAGRQKGGGKARMRRNVSSGAFWDDDDDDGGGPGWSPSAEDKREARKAAREMAFSKAEEELLYYQLLSDMDPGGVM